MTTTNTAKTPKSMLAQEANMSKSPVAVAPIPNQSRQDRLQHLTTQLLWRLQQSSPYHSASSKQLTIPKLPDDTIDLSAAVQPATLVSGLEESGGALYEIGVADDGTLVGLTSDEMTESLSTLRVMAASLGCTVEVMRMVIVGECEWTESTDLVDSAEQPTSHITKTGKLWVAEALVTPSYAPREENGNGSDVATKQKAAVAAAERIPSRGSSTTSQLRITLTGPTTSGKSSLLGTLSTGTLDNGRGKSRLSLLKHRHEMVSGVTSSIAQELIGYKDGAILNFSHGNNIESWTDIHDRAEDGRLVFVSDSGGHPRYRRTVLRGLMNWAPHWSILCIAADDSEQSSKSYNMTLPTAAGDMTPVPVVDLVKAHLTLSLDLEVPMAVVITKMDIASKTALQKTMIKVLSAIKEAGRIPKILQPDQKATQDLADIPAADRLKVQPVVQAMHDAGSLTAYVPIVLTSATSGSGIGLLHALLESLPLPPTPTARDFVGMALNPEQPKSLFHVDDTFNLPVSNISRNDAGGKEGQGVIVSGHMRFGGLSIGDKIVVGPFPPEDDEVKDLAPEDRPSPGGFGLSISHPASAELARIAMRNAVSASEIAGEWLKARVASVRNLKLPVRTLESGQAGSIGLVFESDRGDTSLRDLPRVRRGMVLAIPSKIMLDTGLSLQAASGFTAKFKDKKAGELSVGALVNVYVASVRAAARIVGVSRHRDDEPGNTATDEIGVFSLNDEDESAKEGFIEISLDLLHNREWIEMGSRVILLEGGMRDRSGLEGCVGDVIEIVD